LPRDHLTLFDRGLVEGIHAKEIGGDDRLQHEMHQQPAERLFVESRDMEAPSRPAVADEALLGRALLGVQEIAHALTGEISERRIAGVVRPSIVSSA
jgi:hypothetical protein